MTSNSSAPPSLLECPREFGHELITRTASVSGPMQAAFVDPGFNGRRFGAGVVGMGSVW